MTGTHAPRATVGTPRGSERAWNRPLSLNQTITLTLLLVVASVVLAAVALHNVDRRADLAVAQQREAQRVSEMLAAQFHWFTSGNVQANLTHWARRTHQHPEILMAAVLDPTGAVLVTEPDQPEWASQTVRVLPPASSVASLIPWPPMEGPTYATNVAYATRLDTREIAGKAPLYQLLIVQRTQDSALFRPSYFWTFHVPLLVVSLIGLGLGLYWLRRQVLVPIERLSGIAERAIDPDPSLDWPITGPCHDELDKLASALRDLQHDLQRWRQRATQLERDFDSRVVAETRQINAALSRATRAAWLDGLTGLHNRRALSEKLPTLFKAQVRAGKDLTVVMFDLDNFKNLNDSLGHAAGDDLLEFVGQLLRTTLRADDLAFRYGGDEFLLVYPGLSAEAAAHIAQRVMPLFQQRAKTLSIRPGLSLSAGIASIRLHAPSDARELLSMADEALYHSKRAGKGVSTVFQGSGRALCAP